MASQTICHTDVAFPWLLIDLPHCPEQPPDYFCQIVRGIEGLKGRCRCWVRWKTDLRLQYLVPSQVPTEYISTCNSGHCDSSAVYRPGNNLLSIQTAQPRRHSLPPSRYCVMNAEHRPQGGVGCSATHASPPPIIN